MVFRITDKRVRNLPKPEKGGKIYYDNAVKGFGVNISASGKCSFILNYFIHGRERRITIGQFPVWTATAAREKATMLRLEVDTGQDPLEMRESLRTAWTVQTLAKEYASQHMPNLSVASRKDVQRMWEVHILPFCGAKKLRDLTSKDIDELHRKISLKTPIRANRVLEVFRHSLNLAIRWAQIERNPALGFKRNTEQPKESYLDSTQLEHLLKVLDSMPNQQAANAIRLLIYTGARCGEVLKADWTQFDLTNGIWTKPSSHTKQRHLHRVPLSDYALAVLREMRTEITSPYLFPNQYGQPKCDLKRPWKWLQKQTGMHSLRIHDLRHTFASLLIPQGEALPVIGKLLGHSQHQTTLRYAHLMDDTLRKAANRIR